MHKRSGEYNTATSFSCPLTIRYMALEGFFPGVF